MKKFLLIAAGLLGAGAAVHVGLLVRDSGAFYKPVNLGSEACRVVGTMPGPEDLEYSKLLKGIFVSSDTRHHDASSGAIYFFPDGGSAKQVTGQLAFEFHPHGIGLLEENGRVSLFAVSHRAEQDVVEIFDADAQGSLKHRKTIEGLVTANDVLPLGGNRFYVSLDHGSRNKLRQAIEHYTRVGRGSLQYFDGVKFQPVKEGLLFANGLALDSARDLLYLAVMLEKRILVFTRASSGTPELSHELALPSAPDNVTVDKDGSLYIGTHPNLMALKAHEKDVSSLSPTLVLHIEKPWEKESGSSARVVLADSGEKISAASVALPVGSSLFLGTIFEAKLLECPRR